LQDGVKELLFRAVDLITTVVPPGLPAAMTVGTIYAVKRLKQHKICCTSPPRVNVSGKIKLVCFDKTGTLTEDNMKMKVVVSYDSQSSQIWRQIKPRNFPSRHINKELIIGMATCHELSNSQSGPAEDIAMFEQTQWILADKNVVRAVPSIGSNSGEQEQYTILSQYPFESGLKRMSVLVHAGSESKSEHLAFAKGAPEVIHGLCRVASRPDEDMLKEELSLWTKQGCRVLAIAYKRVKAEAANGLKRVQIERDLKFLGLLVMTSDLKEMTESVINELQAAKIRTVMVTGDYLDTAVSVAKQCGIILPEDRVVCVEPALGANTVEYRTIASRKQTDVSWNGHCNGNAMSTAADLWNDNDLEVLQSVFAMTGESLRRIRDHCRKVDRSDTGVTELDKALVHGAVFARMGPEEKKTLVEDLQGLGYCVCMCGDGANDCKALRAADAGISLSKAEASVAAPFTSQVLQSFVY
jgi:cation-transporting ATPase 13A3/4/5